MRRPGPRTPDVIEISTSAVPREPLGWLKNSVGFRSGSFNDSTYSFRLNSP